MYVYRMVGSDLSLFKVMDDGWETTEVESSQVMKENQPTLEKITSDATGEHWCVGDSMGDITLFKGFDVLCHFPGLSTTRVESNAIELSHSSQTEAFFRATLSIRLFWLGDAR